MDGLGGVGRGVTRAEDWCPCADEVERGVDGIGKKLVGVIGRLLGLFLATSPCWASLPPAWRGIDGLSDSMRLVAVFFLCEVGGFEVGLIGMLLTFLLCRVFVRVRCEEG